jgi:branched-chain amino acid aminotransferase
MSQHFQYFSQNGQILPIDQASVPLDNIAYSYGFGVYETLKVRNGLLYFVDQHVERLLQSAEIITLDHPFTKEAIKNYLQALLESLELTSEKSSCNLKMLLIGGHEPQLFILALAPLFPDRKLYRQGAKTITVHYQRLFPNAKTLNMLASYLAYKKAKEQGCYDALLQTASGELLEGTRTNFYTIKDDIIFTPPIEHILEGVTRQTVLAVAKKEGFTIREADIPIDNLPKYDGAFLTSTSSKIIPIRQIDEHTFQEIPKDLKRLMKAYDTFLQTCNGVF